MKEPTQSSETSAYILRTPGKFPKEYLLLNTQSVYTLALPRAEWNNFVHTTTMCNNIYNYLKKSVLSSLTAEVFHMGHQITNQFFL